MGLAYCTVEDVAQVAQDYRNDIVPITDSGPSPSIGNVNTRTISRAQVEDLIFEASDMTRQLLNPRYSVELIDSMDPEFPPIVIYITKVQAAIYLYERYGPYAVDLRNQNIEIYKKAMEPFHRAIANGELRDTLGLLIKTKNGPSILQGGTNNNFPAIQELQTIYTAGRFYI